MWELLGIALVAWGAWELGSLRRRLAGLERTVEALREQTSRRAAHDVPVARAAATGRPAVQENGPEPAAQVSPVAPTAVPGKVLPATVVQAPSAPAATARPEAASLARERESVPEVPVALRERAEPPTAPPPVARDLDERFDVVGLLKKNPFATAGIALLLLGFAYFFQSIEWGRLISPPMRVVLAWVGAAVLDFAGVRALRHQPLWGQLAQGGAAAIAYLATYVGLVDYGMLAPGSAFTLFVAISAVLLAQALRADSKVLAAVGFLGAYAAPALALQTDAPLLITLAYGLVITTAALAISLYKGWLELAVYSHLCSAGLAALVYTQGSGPIPVVVQQCLVNAYAVQFVAWTVLWVRRHALSGATPVVLAGTLTVAVVSYVALQRWLLLDATFLATTIATSGALLALGYAWRSVAELRETAWVLAALALAAGLTGDTLAPELAAFVLYMEGSLIAATARDWGVRRVLGVLLLVGGAVGLMFAAGPTWPLLLPLAISTGFALRTEERDPLGALHAAVALAAGVATVARWTSDPALAICALLGGAAALATLAMLVTRRISHRATVVYAGAFAVCAILFLAAPAGAWLSLHVSCVLVLAAGAGIAVARADRAEVLDGAGVYAGPAAVALVLLLPFLIAYKAGTGELVLSFWLAAAIVVHVTLEGLGRMQRPWGLPDTERAGLLATASAIALVLAASVLLPHGRSTFAHALGGAVFAASCFAWWRYGAPPQAGARRVLAGAVLAYGGAVWALGLLGSPFTMWERALDSSWPCVLLAAVGVANVFVSSRDADRTGWKVAAAVCVAAVGLLLLLLGGALTSPLGIGGSLLAIGVLFLIAGYLAPLPPAESERAPNA